MIEINSIWIVSISLILITFFAIVFLAKFCTKPFDNISFSFLRVFPCETVQNVDRVSLVYKLCLYLFSIMCFFPIFILSQAHVNLVSFYVATILLGLGSICFVFLHFFNPSHVKAHLFLFSFFAGFVFAGSVVSGLALLTLLNANKSVVETFRVGVIVKSSVTFLIAILELVLLLNPKLKTWAKLDKIEGSENQFSRPKKFPLAYTEWAIYLTLVLSELMLFINIIE